jgi:Fe-S-cluster-containing hydrogenase component 2
MENICLSAPIICEQCDPAPCKNVCPTKAIARDAKTCALLVDPDKCIDCKECIWACPFGAITIRKGIAVKCDLCDGQPECAKVCIPGAIRYADLGYSAMVKKWSSLERRVKALAAII